MFIIFRIYYYSPTGLEIFTIDNKSYYFNLKEIFPIDKNPIINTLSQFFKVIYMKNGRKLGFYNSNFCTDLNPLLNDKIDNWNEKQFFYSNFDKLMIINLFSNRSFNDLNQYPIFPMLYKQISLKRVMGQPIGFQELTNESKARKNLIMESYQYEINHAEDEGEDISNISYFNLFYSNITYTCNYLIRVFPYSFIAIEYQGDGFDDPNRLFFSIKSTFNNTLNQRADLRELIPEMFYFPPLFYNKNEVELKKIANGKEIGNVIIQDWEENKLRKYIFLKEMREELEKEKNLNKWIDLIFGINMEFTESKGRYYNKFSSINFELNENILKDDIIMQSYDFGVLPFQLFSDKFPDKPIKLNENLEKEIYILNKKKFIKDHIEILCYGEESFICKGEKGINKKYLKIVEKIKNNNSSFLGALLGDIKSSILLDNSKYDYTNTKYLFVGDVFGNLYFYKKEDKKFKKLVNCYKKIEEIGKDKKLLFKIIEKEYILLNSVTDHTKEIKFIDYNPRLNLVIDYALDGFINMYSVPKFKLILSIQTKDLNINEIIKFIVLLSNPFPMICCIFLTKIIVLDINGVLINQIDIENTVEFEFSIDKNCGLFNDYICFIKDRKEVKIDFLKINK